jgi:hypothetical protein
MSDDGAKVVRVRAARSARRTAQVLTWLRWLLPAAVLVVTPAAGAPVEREDAVTIDAEEACSGPLSVADALARALRR